MKVDKLKINNYGKLKDREFRLEEGINIIKGYNEAGKSTILSFMNSMLYGIDKSKRAGISEYDRYLPWLSTDFSGTLEYRLDNGKKYHIYRDFKKTLPTIMEEGMNDISKTFVQDKKNIDFLSEQIGIDKTTFQNSSISYQKLVVLDETKKADMVNKMTNLVTTGEENLSYENIIKTLNSKQIEEIGTARTKKRPINNVEERILRLEKEKYEALSVKDKKQRMTEEREKVQKIFAELGKKKEVLSRIKESYLETEADTKLRQEIKRMINQKKEEISEKKEEKVDTITKESIIKNTWKIILPLIILAIASGVLYIYLLPVIIFVIIFTIVRAIVVEKKRMNALEEKNRGIEKEINILRKDIIEYERGVIKEETEYNQKMEEVKSKIYSKYLLSVGADYLDKVIDKSLENLILEIEEVEKNYETTMYRLSQINAERNVVESEAGKLSEIVEELEELIQERDSLVKYNESFEVAKKLLEESYNDLKSNIGPGFNSRLSYIVSKITEGRYTEVVIDNDHQIYMKNQQGEYIPLERYSTGTIEQVNLALRLVLLEKISKEKLPIILDEAFAFTDDNRLKNILQFFYTEYPNRQIIIFTCSNREKETIQELGIEANIILV